MKLTAFLLFLVIGMSSIAQRTPNKLNLHGTVLGYEYEPKSIFKKDQIDIQGSVGAVKLEVFSGSKKISSTTSNSGGDFSLGIPANGKYQLRYSKSGYGKSAIDIDLNGVPEEIAKGGLLLRNIELLLNDFESDKAMDNGEPFGKLYYSGDKFKFSVTEFSKKEALFKKREDNAPANVMMSSVEKNKANNAKPFKVGDIEEDIIEEDLNTDLNSETIQGPQIISVKEFEKIKSSKLSDISDWKNLNTDDISKRSEELAAAWDQLEEDRLIAVTPEDFMAIQLREEMLNSAEAELEAAKAYIDEQESKLSAQSNLNYALIALALILAGLAFFIFKRFKEKKETNILLEAKNKKITDSINYAERIQRSVLLADEQIAAILPNSFIFYKPLDVVSGDFYWVSEIGNKVIFSAVDCTGHGVPGAFMSLIANTLLNQIVNEKKITEPAKILEELHNGIVNSLHQEDDAYLSQDGMDMSICTLNKTSNELSFAGAMNPGFIVQSGEVKELMASLNGVGGVIQSRRKRPVRFIEEKVQVNSGDSLFLFSDGFMDQFGGSENKKFNIQRFKEMLLELNGLSPEDQKKKAEQTFNNWKGETHQIDDVLLMGVKF
jgi:serine phosphatase RsbU (regulator of sigma subunit)